MQVGREELEGLLVQFEELKKGAAGEHMSGNNTVIMMFGAANAYWASWDFFSYETPTSICRLGDELGRIVHIHYTTFAFTRDTFAGWRQSSS